MGRGEDYTRGGGGGGDYTRGTGGAGGEGEDYTRGTEGADGERPEGVGRPVWSPYLKYPTIPTSKPMAIADSCKIPSKCSTSWL